MVRLRGRAFIAAAVVAVAVAAAGCVPPPDDPPPDPPYPYTLAPRDDYRELSADGRIAIGDQNPELHVWDTVTGATEEVPELNGIELDSRGVMDLSGDGSRVAWIGYPSDGTHTISGVRAYMWDRNTDTVQQTPEAFFSISDEADVLGVGISRDGQTAALAVGWSWDSYELELVLWDLASNTLTATGVVTEPTYSNYADVHVSAGGELVLLEDVMYEPSTGQTWERPAVANSRIYRHADMTLDGSLVLVNHYPRFSTPEVYLWDVAAGTMTRTEPAPNGPPDAPLEAEAISDDGTTILYNSAATNLVAGDTNGARDMFIWDRTQPDVVRQPVGSDGNEANGETFGVAMSGDASEVLAGTSATNLVGSHGDDEYPYLLWRR